MGLTSVVVDPEMVGRSGGRLDTRYHAMHRKIGAFTAGLVDPVPLSQLIRGLRNGTNVPKAAYDDPESESSTIYASVGAFSSFFLREPATTPLRVIDDRIVGTSHRVESVKTSVDELLITRSGTPGIAWTGSAANEREVIPSGFMMRGRADSEDWATYLTAVLNHPVWRAMTLGLSAGKRQDNLNQEQLGSIPIPSLADDAVTSVAGDYRALLSEISSAFTDDSDFRSACDRVLNEAIGLPFLPSPAARLRAATISIRDLGPGLRLDNRWHGPSHREALSHLETIPTVELRSVLATAISKGNSQVGSTKTRSTVPSRRPQPLLLFSPGSWLLNSFARPAR